MTSHAVRAYAETPTPSADTPWRAVPYCVLDLETTGLDPRNDEIVSYAAVPIDDGRVIAAGIRQSLIRPVRPIRPESARIHGIRPVDVSGAPPWDAVLDDLLSSMTGRVLVVHVDWVERGFLGRALSKTRLKLREPILDTNRLARSYLPAAPETIRLSGLARKLNIPVQGQHQALGDALVTAQVFLALATQMDRRLPQSLKTLADAGARREFRDRLRERFQPSA